MKEELYPDTIPYNSGLLDVGDGHRIYFEECGNKAGFPVIFLHGGPGSSCAAFHRRYFDPKFYRVVLFDQRGCGKSLPTGKISNNSTQHLINDIELLREKLNLTKVLIFGGSWGSALGLAYTQNYPDAVAGLILRGVFLARQSEIDWFLKGLRYFIPEAIVGQPDKSVEQTVQYYYDKVFLAPEDEAKKFGAEWANHEINAIKVGSVAPELISGKNFKDEDLESIKIQLHYMKNKCFLEENELLMKAKIIDSPAIIVQGRLDMVCPPVTAFELSRSLQNCQLRFVEKGGHSGRQQEMAVALCKATEDFKRQVNS